MHITALWIYPIKSLPGVSLSHIRLEGRGMEWDRRWMLIDENGQFLSQRNCPKMALLKVGMNDSSLWVKGQGDTLEIPFPAYDFPEIEVKIWRSLCQAQVFPEAYNAWFSKELERPCRLVFMPYTTRRAVNPQYGPDHIVSFADGYPFLLTSENSLNDLNLKLDQPVEMIRFRPNLVMAGAIPFQEYEWDVLNIGKVKLRHTKPCERCSIVNLNPLTAQAEKEPLKTLATYPQHQEKVCFGINLVAEALGYISLGERIFLSQTPS